MSKSESQQKNPRLPIFPQVVTMPQYLPYIDKGSYSPVGTVHVHLSANQTFHNAAECMLVSFIHKWQTSSGGNWVNMVAFHCNCYPLLLELGQLTMRLQDLRIRVEGSTNEIQCTNSQSIHPHGKQALPPLGASCWLVYIDHLIKRWQRQSRTLGVFELQKSRASGESCHISS